MSMRGVIVSAAALAGACGLLYWPALAPANTFSGMDFLNLLYPEALVVKTAFARGEFPLWNWLSWGGSPLLAAMQSAALYPPMWLTLALPLPYGLQVSIVLHLVWAGLGAAVLARTQLGVGTIGSIFAGAAYAGSGFFLGHIEQVNSIAAMAWAPWVFAAGLSYLRNGVSPVLFVICATMALLAGHPQHVVLSLLFFEICLVALVLVEWFGGRGQKSSLRNTPWRRLVLLQVGVGFAGLLSAAQLFPTQELSGLSERVWPYADPNAPAFEWRYLAAFITPRFFNRLADTPGQPVQYAELGVYCGMIAVPLFLAGLWSIGRRRDSCALAIGITWLFSFLYALGNQGFLTALIFRLVPFLGHSRGAARALNIETLTFACIAGLGLDACARALQRRMGAGLKPVWVGCGAVVVLLLDLAVTHSREFNSLIVRAQIVALSPRLLSHVKCSPEHGGRLYRFMANDSDYYLDHRPQAVRERVERFQPDLNYQFGIATWDGYEEGLLPTRAYANFVRCYNRNLRNDFLDTPLLALMQCNTVLTEYPMASLGSGWHLAATANGGASGLYRLWQSDYPATWFIEAQTVGIASPGENGRVGFPETRTAIGTPVRIPAGNSVVPHPFSDLTSATFASATASARLAPSGIATNRINLSGPAEPQRRILFLQSCYPGWKLRDVGKPQDGVVLRRQSPIIASFVWPPAGASGDTGDVHAQLVFEPFSFRLGCFVSLLSLAALAGLCLHSAYRRRNHAQDRQ